MILGAAILGAAFLLGTMGRYELSANGQILLDRWKGRVCLVDPTPSVVQTGRGERYKLVQACWGV